jgi:UDP-N-acetyl-2-amino-2-deoxyglucuronate dehydrogenase
MVSFGIIGCGHIANKHAEQIEQIENARLAAVCDKIPEAMKPFVEKYNTKAYKDLDDMLTNEQIDVVCICTPSGLHAPLTIQAANAKKHIIVEKPIALTLEDADVMIKTCEENGVKLSVVHPNRFRPAVMELRKVMDQGMFGKLSHANATVRWNRNQAYYDQAPWRGTKSQDGGVLMNQAIHNLDLLTWFMGDIDEVFSMDATRLRNIEAEDVSIGVVRFKNGTLGVVEAATTIYPTNFEESLSIFGEHGTVKIGGNTANYIKHWEIDWMNSEETQELINKIEKDPFGRPGHHWIIEDMIDAVENDRDPVITGEEGKKALQLVLALYQSAEINQTVKLNS